MKVKITHFFNIVLSSDDTKRNEKEDIDIEK